MNRIQRRLVAAAAQLLDAAAEEITVIVARGVVEVLHPEPPPSPPAQLPDGISQYDTAIIRAITDRPMSSARIARRSGHLLNSYFRERLAALVEAGLIRRTRRGYQIPGT